MTPDRGRTDVNRQNETFLLETVLMAAHRSKLFPRYSLNRSRVLHGQVTLVLFTASIYLCEVGGGGEQVYGTSDRRFFEVQHQLTHDWRDKEIQIFSVFKKVINIVSLLVQYEQLNFPHLYDLAKRLKR